MFSQYTMRQNLTFADKGGKQISEFADRGEGVCLPILDDVICEQLLTSLLFKQ